MPGANDDEPRGADDADVVAQLIRTAGRRAEPPAQTYERVLAAATAAWELKLRRRRRWRIGSAVAASTILASVTLLLVSHLQREPALVAGRTDRIVGTLELETSGGTWTAIRDEAVDVRAGARVRTRSDSFAGILLADGISLRLADATDIVLESHSVLRVLAGKIYLDTGRLNGELRESGRRRVEVITPAGTASDVGTQFEVRYRDAAYRLRVREGRVALNRAAGTIDSAAGEQVTIHADGALERTRFSTDDADWQWAQSVAPMPVTDGQPVSVLLAWVARETGKPVRFEKPDVERRASTTILHGNIRHLSPLEALAVMLATTDLEHVILDDGTILIRLKTIR